jgi:hypothetical protein
MAWFIHISKVSDKCVRVLSEEFPKFPKAFPFWRLKLQCEVLQPLEQGLVLGIKSCFNQLILKSLRRFQ